MATEALQAETRTAAVTRVTRQAGVMRCAYHELCRVRQSGLAAWTVYFGSQMIVLVENVPEERLADDKSARRAA